MHSPFILSIVLANFLHFGNTYWPYSGAQPVSVEATTAVNAPLKDSPGGGGAAPPAAQPPVADGTFGGAGSNPSSVSSSYRDLTFVNNGCVYHNGKITENGKTRQATPEEEAKVQEYLAASQRYQEQFRQSMEEEMKRIFAPPFPFGQNAQFPSFPQFPQIQLPDTPCFCESCRNFPTNNAQMQSLMNNGIAGGQNVPNSANAYNGYSMASQQQQVIGK